MGTGLALTDRDHGKREGDAPGGVTMFPLPSEVAARLRPFFLDKKSGNISLNVQHGRILGLRVEEIFSVKP